MKINLFIPLAFICLISCNQNKQNSAQDTAQNTQTTIEDNNPLLGDWVEPNPIDIKENQGVRLYADGKAESINMATLLYKKWWQKKDSLFLVQESIGNKVSSTDTIVWQIEELKDKEIVLKNNQSILRHLKQ